jgi:hypothetical protein
MDQLQQQHHVEDVGRILLQTQEQLRAMREQMTAAAAAVEAAAAMRQSSSSSNVAASDVQAFNDILQRAELELQSKAELVLNGLVHASSVTASTHHHDRDDPGWSRGMSLPAVAASQSPFTASSPALRDRSRLMRPTNPQELDVDYFRSVRGLLLHPSIV